MGGGRWWNYGLEPNSKGGGSVGVSGTTSWPLVTVPQPGLEERIMESRVDICTAEGQTTASLESHVFGHGEAIAVD